MKTIREITFDVLRQLNIRTVVGNPGSTEETFLQNFPKDFKYILALQESSVIGIADGLSQGLKQPVLVNVHTGAGMGNAMNCILTAFINKTPLIITAGQQTREMLLMEPFLTNVDAVTLPKPWVKWSYEPARPEDVPGAFMRAYAMAMQPPHGPVFLSLPLDDWDKEMADYPAIRSLSTRVAADPARVKSFAERINQSKKPVLVYGGDISRSNAWDQGLAFAEKLNAPVWIGPFSERISFPENHPLFAGALPAAIGPLSKALGSHDLVIVIGAPVFRYYPWVPGEYLPTKAELLQIIDDPYEAAKSPVGDSLLSDSGLALDALLPLVNDRAGGKQFVSRKVLPQEIAAVSYPMTADNLFNVLSQNLPKDYILVQESPSNVPDLSSTRLGTITKPDSYYTMSSGGLGWDLPAAVGLGIAEIDSGRGRPVILIIGDGSFQYSPQAIWTAVQHNIHLIIVVLRNEEYGILKAFAKLEKTPNVPALDLPGIDSAAIAKGYGARSIFAESIETIQASFQQALNDKGVTVIEVPIDKSLKPLI